MRAMQRNTRQRLLDLMVARIGRPALAAHLDVPIGILDAWLHGIDRMPDAKLGTLIDLIDQTNAD